MALVKQLGEHAYGKSSPMDESLLWTLEVMKKRVVCCRPCDLCHRVLFTDASCETEMNTGGFGRCAD